MKQTLYYSICHIIWLGKAGFCPLPAGSNIGGWLGFRFLRWSLYCGSMFHREALEPDCGTSGTVVATGGSTVDVVWLILSINWVVTSPIWLFKVAKASSDVVYNSLCIFFHDLIRNTLEVAIKYLFPSLDFGFVRIACAAEHRFKIFDVIVHHVR